MWSASASESSERDRADLAANPAEVVEQPGSLERQLRDQRRCAQNVHAVDSTLRLRAQAEKRQVTDCYKAVRASLIHPRADREASSLWSAASSPPCDARALPRPGGSGPGAAAPRAPRGASRRAARRRARGSELAPLVLRDRAKDGPGARDHTPLLRVGQRPGRLDIEARPRPAWTTSGRAARRGRSSGRRESRSRRAAGKRSA